MPFVTPQMPLFVDMRKGSNNLCYIIAANIYLIYGRRVLPALSSHLSRRCWSLKGPVLGALGIFMQDQASDLGALAQLSSFLQRCALGKQQGTSL